MCLFSDVFFGVFLAQQMIDDHFSVEKEEAEESG